jgi:hypothetical protein
MSMCNDEAGKMTNGSLMITLKPKDITFT